MDMLLNAFGQLNPMAVIAATVVTFFFGWAWHSPLLFMSQWMAVNKMPDIKPDPKKMINSMGLGVLNTAMINICMAMLLVMFGVNSLTEGLTIGLVAWAGTSLYEGFGLMIWEKKSFTALWVKSGHTLGVILIGITVLVIL